MSLANNTQSHEEEVVMTNLEAEMIRDAVKSFTVSESPLTVVRAAEAGDWTEANNSWPKLAKLGWLEILQYEEAQKEGFIAACIIAEELGRAAYPMPFAETAVLALPLLRVFAEDKVDLDVYSSGEKRVAFALPLNGLPTKVEGLAALNSGATWIANQLESAELLIVPTVSHHQPALALIPRPSMGWQVSTMPDLANNSYSKLSNDNFADAILVELPWQALANAFDQFRLVTSAYIVGLASQVTDIAVEYAKERMAFEKPIGSFQAVQHRLAESALEISAAHLLVQEAAVTGDYHHIPIACLQTSEAGKKATFTAQQIWAGMGYTMEVDVQLFFRRARAYQFLLGTTWELKERIWDNVVPHS